jgi:hypothetical protein
MATAALSTSTTHDRSGPPAASPPQVRHPRLLWLWPLLGLLIVASAGTMFGPAATLLAAVVGCCVLVLYLAASMLDWRVVLVVVFLPILVAGLVLMPAVRRTAFLQTGSPAENSPAADQGTPGGSTRLTREQVLALDPGSAALRGARLDGIDLHHVDLVGRDLSGASLVGTNLRDADLRDVRLRGAQLSRADLRGACSDRANLAGAVVTGTKIRGAHMPFARLPDARDGAGAEWRTPPTPCPR